jgi:flavin reductase (DIM6/NTAB) family NADH-FMN oxidoreductase RutF
MFYDAVKNNHGFAVEPLKAIVAPRPIAWISSLSIDGVANLAPYSFFNIFSDDPAYIAFGSGGVKDSLRNARDTGEFAVNLVTHDLREAMNASSANAGPHVDEFALAGVQKAQCQFIKAPRVAESLACLECRLFKVIDLPDDEGHTDGFLVIGRVLGVHIDDRFIENGRVNTAAMQPVARLGYSEYATVTEAWRMRRPA